MHIGRALGTALVGFAVMLFASLDLVLFGVVAFASPLVAVLLVVGLVGGAALGWFTSRRRDRRLVTTPPTAPPSVGAPPPPAPMA
jgi:hypothetical protein